VPKAIAFCGSTGCSPGRNASLRARTRANDRAVDPYARRELAAPDRASDDTARPTSSESKPAKGPDAR
jgi:hypothetical protein